MLPLLELHPQAVARVDGGAGVRADLGRHLRRGRELKVVAAQEHRQGHGGLEHGELVAYALARPRPERSKRKVRRVLRGVQLAAPRPGVVPLPPRSLLRVHMWPQEPLRVKVVRLRPVPPVAVDVVERDEDVRTTGDLRLEADATLREDVVLERAADEQRRLRVHAQALGHAEAHELEVLHLVHVRQPIPKLRVHLLLHPSKEGGVLGELVDGPGKRGRRGLVTGDEHGHQVVAQLLRVRLLAARVHEEAQQRRVVELAVVAPLEVLDVRLLAGAERLADAVVEGAVKEVHVLLELALARDEVRGERQLPVGRRGHGAVLGLAQRGDGGSHHGGVGLALGIKVVVKNGLADDVEREGAELVLHVHGIARLGGLVEDVRAGLLRHVAEHAAHVAEPGLVEARHDGAAALVPGLRVRRDEALAHDGLEDLGEDALVVALGVVAQHVLEDLRVGHDGEALRAEAELEEPALVLVELVQAEVHGTVLQAVHLALGERHAIGARVAAVDLLNVLLEDLHGIAELERLASLARLGEGQLPEVVPPPGQALDLAAPLQVVAFEHELHAAVLRLRHAARSHVGGGGHAVAGLRRLRRRRVHDRTGHRTPGHRRLGGLRRDVKLRLLGSAEHHAPRSRCAGRRPEAGERRGRLERERHHQGSQRRPRHTPVDHPDGASY
mmetsp:Transcript_8221/g.23391  ORF Transcript_8221/g.23391 Transcript_8221/m.23391 type:complete len:670 (-) Transcript_8221:431-2440(-)